MTETTSTRLSITRLILVPSVITLAVTILRLIGELQHWSKAWFNPAPGGPGAIVGITWLVPIFGIYFALKLSNAGGRPAHMGRAIGLALLGLAVLVGGSFLGAGLLNFPGKRVVGYALMAAGAALPLRAWPALGKTLLAYGYAARIPVAIVMFFAIRGDWGTHYDVVGPRFPEMGFWPKYVLIGLLPQLIFWVAFTVIMGSLFGSLATALLHRRSPAPQAT